MRQNVARLFVTFSKHSFQIKLGPLLLFFFITDSKRTYIPSLLNSVISCFGAVFLQVANPYFTRTRANKKWIQALRTHITIC
jgi:hypothetical protein